MHEDRYDDGGCIAIHEWLLWDGGMKMPIGDELSNKSPAGNSLKKFFLNGNF